MRTLILTTIVAFLGSTSLVFACQPPRNAGHRIATNIELVQRADVIVLARVVDGPPQGAVIEYPGEGRPQIILKPIEVLKGTTVPDQQLRLYGSLFDWRGRAVRPAPTPLTEAHPNAYEGGCIRLQFAKGALVVAMFKRTEAGLRELTFPMTRDVEDVSDTTSTWVRAVRLYAQATSFRAATQRRKLVLLQSQLEQSERADDREIADDIRSYLRVNLKSKKQRAQLWSEFPR